MVHQGLLFLPAGTAVCRDPDGIRADLTQLSAVLQEMTSHLEAYYAALGRAQGKSDPSNFNVAIATLNARA